jgi:hypothetical protein
MGILTPRKLLSFRFYLIDASIMSENLSIMVSDLPMTPQTPTPLPQTSKSRRGELSNAQIAEIRRYFYEDSNNTPSQKQVIQWFEEKHYHKLTQSQVSKILSEQYSFLDEEK